MDNDLIGSLSKYRDVLLPLGDNEPSSSLEAQAVLEYIRAEKGYLDPENERELRTLSQHTQQTFRRIIQRNRKTEANYTKNISEQLYSTGYRFLYELVQNADDSSYKRITDNKESPYLRFIAKPDQLIVDTNEDGFTRANVIAICATGETSKKATKADNHIGEKGFGFKSVFAVAEEVQVQSGLWSFYFRHCKGEDGLGMVTPIDSPCEELPRKVKTRIRLRYSQETKDNYKRLLDAIRELPDTLIMFLQRLPKIYIEITSTDGASQMITLERKNEPLKNKITIYRTQCSINEVTVDTRTFLTYHSFKWDMPNDERRKNRNVDITLAFPVDTKTSQPRVSSFGQHVFAFLPLKRLSYLQFLVQSDFICAASREDIVECPWNTAICEGVAKTFAEVVESTFAKPDHPLRYSWLKYLPGTTLDPTWRFLQPTIINLLKSRPILQSWEGRTWKSPEQLRIVPSEMLHMGKPLLPDSPNELYLAPEYKHVSRLRELGVHRIRWGQVVDRLQVDLAKTSTSRTKNTNTTDPWHETFATLFSRLLSYSGAALPRERLLKLNFIPLRNPKQWTGKPGISPGGPKRVFFAFQGQSLIPENLGLFLLDEAASRNIERRKFYAAVGVEECSPQFIYEQIKQAHQIPFGAKDPTGHLVYLFEQLHDPAELHGWVCVPIMNEVAQKASTLPLYFPSDGEFDTYQLVSSTTKDAKFMPKAFFDGKGITIRQDGYSWKEWLQEATGARYFPPLYERVRGESIYTLSKILKEVLERDSGRFLAVLRAHWFYYAQDAHLAIGELHKCLIPCGISGCRYPLHDTYFPHSSILTTVKKLGVERDKLPILSLPGDLEDYAIAQSWRFLTTDCGVRSTLDLDFFLMIITNWAEASTPPDHGTVAKGYFNLAKLARTDDYGMLQTRFHENDFIWDPQNSFWVNSSECLWDGPDFMTCRTVLKGSYSSSEYCETFFTRILNVNNWTLDDIFEELQHRRESCGLAVNTQLLAEVYAFLDSNVVDEKDWKTIRSRFMDEQLVLGADMSWQTLKKCVWSSAFALSGYQDLSLTYPTLEGFFVRRLHVKKATLSMLVQEIKRMAAARSPSISDIRSRLVEVGMMLSKIGINDSIALALESLQEEKFLPKHVNEGTTTLVGVEDAFAIPDHPRYSEALKAQGVLLAFSLDEVQILDVIFRHLKLTHRYLSQSVEEVSTVGDDSVKDYKLSQKLQSRAYALFCCAAKHKSKKALRDHDGLFKLLSEVEVYSTTSISTDLVLNLERKSVRVPSNRAFIYHHIPDRILKIYMPVGEKQQRSSYRSQLPKLLSNIVCGDDRAALDISTIIECNIMDLDDVLIEQDIADVAWIEKPSVDLASMGEERNDSPLTDSIPFVAQERRGSHLIPETPIRHASVFSETVASEVLLTPPPSEYADFVDQVIHSAQRANNLRRPGIPVANSPPYEREYRWFDHERTFGMRERDQFAHDRRVGAPGEAYVFEILSGLDLPNFSQANWQSTIRGVLSGSTRFANIQNWVGRETADIVYGDHTGALTNWLRENCTGGFPAQIPIDHNHSQYPIEYFLEVKTTTGECTTRFYMSNKQYERMGNLQLHAGQVPRNVYVIMRVYDLLQRDVGLKVFVDPARFNGTWLHFEAERWFVNTVEQGY